MNISLEDLAAIRTSDRSINPECLCDEYATLILIQDEKLKKIRDILKNESDPMLALNGIEDIVNV